MGKKRHLCGFDLCLLDNQHSLSIFPHAYWAAHVFGEMTIKPCPFFSAWMLLLLLSCGRSLYIVGTNSSSDVRVAGTSSCPLAVFRQYPFMPRVPSHPFNHYTGLKSQPCGHTSGVPAQACLATALLMGTGARVEGRGARGQAGTAHTGHRRAAWGGRPQGPRGRACLCACSRQWAKGARVATGIGTPGARLRHELARAGWAERASTQGSLWGRSPTSCRLTQALALGS